MTRNWQSDSIDRRQPMPQIGTGANLGNETHLNF